ncbi:MAG: ferrous iron transport protein B [Dehalococcoidia bacterium]|nr:ferrous iron transport protein B [Dehalococcoidia bacterium]
MKGRAGGKTGRKILLVGNPNVGKSVIFHHLTGKYAQVSNYPGTTVMVTSGNASFGDGSVVIDSPGANSLSPRSEDERVTRDLLLKEDQAVVIQVADTKNLSRALLLTAQLSDAGTPMVLALNMTDEAELKGINIDIQKLSHVLRVPVVATTATRGLGIQELQNTLEEARPAKLRVRFSSDIEHALLQIEELIPELPLGRRAVALMLLCGDTELENWLQQRAGPQAVQAIYSIAADLQSRNARPIDYLINRVRSREVQRVMGHVAYRGVARSNYLADTFGRWSTHPLAGIPILAFILLLLYYVVGVVGAGIVVDLVESVLFGEYIIPAVGWLFALLPIPLLQDLMVGEYGLVSVGLTYAVAIILPVVGFFFICFSLLEDIGYLPRLAVMANVVLRRIGLSGKAVLPLILGLGCDTMATLTTRTLESKKERLIATLLLALAVPCSAQMAVILALLGGISGTAVALFFAIILIQLLLVGFLASRILPGDRPDFVLEIPPIRVPQLSNVVTKTLARMEWYFKEAVPLFLAGTFILFVLDKLGALVFVESAFTPVVEGWLGLPAATAAAFIMGFLRRDFGAAGLFMLAEQGLLDANQILVSLVVITLFIPCIANLFVIIKERGLRVGIAIVGFVFPYAIVVGGLLNLLFRALKVGL